jgi:hypothetical protein
MCFVWISEQTLLRILVSVHKLDTTIRNQNCVNEGINHLNAELNPICRLLAFLGAHHIFHVSGLRVKVRLNSANGWYSLFRARYVPSYLKM